MHPILQVLIGGAIGSLARYGVSFLLPTTNGHSFPWNTFFVNLMGCFVIGLVLGFILREKIHPSILPLLVTGVLGGFTTFSSFGLEAIQLFQNKQVPLAVYYVLGTNIAGLLLVFSGYRLAQV